MLDDYYGSSFDIYCKLMDFNTCLSKWKEAELKVLKHIQKKYRDAYIIDGYCKGRDIHIPEIDIGIEVKWDIVSERTGNYLFEALCDGKPSWISTTDSKWWCIVDNHWLHYFTIEKIYETIIRNTIGLTKFTGEYCNDKIEMEWYIVPKKLLWK